MVQREKEKNKNGVEKKKPMFITFKMATVLKSQRLVVTQHTILLILNFLSQLLVKNLKEHHSIQTYCRPEHNNCFRDIEISLSES